MFVFEKGKLRVCAKYLRSDNIGGTFRDYRFIILQHILTDTEEFVQEMLRNELIIHSIVAKPYSIDEAVFRRILKSGVKVVREDYTTIERVGFLDQIILSAIEECKLDRRKILICDVGGYFGDPLVRVRIEAEKYIAGIVEVTKFGHNKYKKIYTDIPAPIISIAESPIKTLEGRFVGMSAVNAVEQLLREVGISISGRTACMIGFGLIGKNVAAALRAKNMPVCVHDTNGFQRAEAFTLGYSVGIKRDLISRADLILSATADRAINMEDIMQCKRGCVIGSVGSKRNEIDVEGIEREKKSEERINDHIKKFLFPNGHYIYLLKNGEAVNFLLKSCPDEIIDLIYAETIYGWLQIIEQPFIYEKGKELYKTLPEVTNMIAGEWLSLTGYPSEEAPKKRRKPPSETLEGPKIF